jgi:hypothetical protein
VEIEGQILVLYAIGLVPALVLLLTPRKLFKVVGALAALSVLGSIGYTATVWEGCRDVECLGAAFFAVTCTIMLLTTIPVAAMRWRGSRTREAQETKVDI